MLGLGLSRYGLHTVKARVRAVVDLFAPSTMGGLHRMLGMFGYYCMFIRTFAKVAAPLNALNKGEGTKDYDSKRPLPWTNDCEIAYDELKDHVASAPILAHPRFDRSCILYTDASNITFGAVLAQVWTEKDYNFADDDVERPTACALEGMDWKKAYLEDQAFRTAYSPLSESDEKDDPNYRLDVDGSLRFRSSMGAKVSLPAAMLRSSLEIAYDALGHFGFEKTYDRLNLTYYRPGLSTAVKQYIQYCPLCFKNKTSHAKREGMLQPIDLPSEVEPLAFRSINMDLIVVLPKSGNYHAILVIVDRCTKTGIFVPTVSSYTAELIAELLFDNVVRKGYIPEKIMTHRDTKITKLFWKTIGRRLDLKQSLTAAWHVQTDGAAERLNQTLETATRVYVSPQIDNWHELLAMLKLAYNTAKNATTGMTPFDLLYVQPQNIVERILSPGTR
jgi:hypothetical protein